MTIEDHLKKLDGLWEKTGGEDDWVMVIHHILTEPVCPTCTIRPEGSNMLRYTATADTVEEAVVIAVDLVYREVILGQPIQPVYPITNPDDHTYLPPHERSQS